MTSVVRTLLPWCAVVVAGCSALAAGPDTTTPVQLPFDGSAGGSGCQPGGEALPDGLWFGFPVEVQSDSLGFDLACWFTGEAAVQAAAQDRAEPPPNDYYIRNDNPTVRQLDVAPTTGVDWYPDFGDPSSEARAGYGDWVDAYASRGYMPGVWITVDGGRVVDVVEQWTP